MASSPQNDLQDQGTNQSGQNDGAHDDDFCRLKAADDANINNLFSSNFEGTIEFDGPIDQTDKAANAIDYEDFSDDDDLPDEEPGDSGSGDAPGLTDDGGTPNDEDFDLFGENEENLFTHEFDKHEVAIQHGHESENTENQITLPSPPEFRDVNFDPVAKELPADERIRKAKLICPNFELGTIPYINEWFPPRKAYYNPRSIAKLPKPLTHPKISLEIATGDERTFRSTTTNVAPSREQLLQDAAARGITLDLPEEEEVEEFDKRDFTMLSEDEVLHAATGLTIAQARFALQDSDPPPRPIEDEPEDETPDEYLESIGAPAERAAKRRKPDNYHLMLIDRTVFPVPSFDNFQELTAQTASRIILDENDHTLLLARVEPRLQNKRFANGDLKNVAKKSISRYNLSNDDATEALKANNQSKVRATIGAVEIEHSMPALKCAWPYYKVKRQTHELRAFHRLPLKFNKFVDRDINFAKSNVRKKKHMKGLTTKQIFAKTSDLSLNDNAAAMLLEYSEEIPTVLSNFGMGSKVLNYYRKTNDQDNTRPKLDVGEPRVLQPTDESPFNKFGSVQPGQTVPTLHNSMYRAAIYKHEPRPNDFLVVRNTTGTGGTHWYLRNIDHMYVVGQQLPSIEVPGPHSRKVTTATRNRMTMVSFRLIRHNDHKHVKVGDITAHIEDSSDMQNRQKLKEILKYDKDKKVWKLKDDQTAIDEDSVRAMISPEDVCLIDAMQVGVRQLEDAGYAQGGEEYDAEQDKTTDSVIQQLAPWRTTKAFLEASAGKAMLELRGHGDPSGCEIAFSMIKTSMKGGFMKNMQHGSLGTSADAMERTQKKAPGGHDYNVSEQEAKYAQVLDETWNKQRVELSNPEDRTDLDHNDLAEDATKLAMANHYAATPGSQFDDSASMVSDARSTKQLRIHRMVRNSEGELVQKSEVVTDPRVAREYTKRRALRDADKINIYDLSTTGDPEADKAKQLRAQQELDRLQRNKERRLHRERQRQTQQLNGSNNSPGPSTPGPSDVGGDSGININGSGSQVNGKSTGGKKKTIPGTTARRCANCAASGHIKTNRKLCPMLNGEWPGGVQPPGWVPGGQRGSVATPAATPNANGTATSSAPTGDSSTITDGAENAWPGNMRAGGLDGADDYPPPNGDIMDDFAMNLEMGGMDVDMGMDDDAAVKLESVL